MRSGARPELAVVAELVAVDAGELVDDRFAAGGDALVEIGHHFADQSGLGRQRERHVFDLAAKLGQLVAFQIGELRPMLSFTHVTMSPSLNAVLPK